MNARENNKKGFPASAVALDAPNADRARLDASMRALAPSGAFDIMERLESAGFPAYLVGGCVRDVLAGRVPHDWDITTSATPDEMKRVLPYASFDTGIEHGTVTFLVEGEPFEVTVFRTEGAYSDGRHPDSVSFAATVEEDLARRDFTVNAMAWSPSRGLTDPYLGASDLASSVLRAVGDPFERFSEDALRIMRAVRFSAVQNLDIEPATAKAVHDSAYKLDAVSAERISSELLKMLCAEDGKHLADVLDEFKDVLFCVIPEMEVCDGYEQDNPNHDRDLWRHSLDTMSAVPPSAVLRLAALIHDVGKPASREYDEDGVAHYKGHMKAGEEITRLLAKRLKLSREQADALSFLVGNHDNRPRETPKSARRFVVKMKTDEMLFDMLSLMRADILAHSPDSVERVMPRFEEAYRLVERAREEELAMKVSDLAIGGRELMDMGYAQGPLLGAALSCLFNEVTDGALENDEVTLSARAQELLEALARGDARLSENRKELVFDKR